MNQVKDEYGMPLYHEVKPHYIKRILWNIVYYSLFRILPTAKLRYVRNIILRLFGAKLPLDVSVFPSAKIFAPWNLEMEPFTTIGPTPQIYNKDKIKIGHHSVVSQGVFLCTAGHDIKDAGWKLITAPIIMEPHTWVAADAYIGMGVTIHEGAVVGARAAVFKDVEPWTVVGGNPAKFIKKRDVDWKPIK